MSDESMKDFAEVRTGVEDKIIDDRNLFKIEDSDKMVEVSVHANSLTLLLLMMVPATAAISGDFVEAVISGHTMRRFMDARPELMEKFKDDIEKLATISCDAGGMGDKYREVLNAQC